MLFSFFDNVIRSLTLLFTVVSIDNFEPALKDFCYVETRAKKNSKQRLPPERKRDMIRWLTYLKHFVKILSNRYQDFNQYQSLFSSESYSGHVGDCFLESGRQLPYLEAIFLVEKEIYIPNSNFASGSTCLTARKKQTSGKAA